MSKKSKSPPAPSYSLKDLYENAEALYEEFGRNSFKKEEMAPTLGHKSTSSGAFARRFFSLKELGLIESSDESGEEFAVTDRFLQMRTNDKGSSAFQRAAKEAIESASVFSDILGRYEGKLPSQGNVANRLEGDLGFNPNRSETVARVFEESMKFAGLLDENNNILPVDEADVSDEDKTADDEAAKKPGTKNGQVEAGDRLTTQIPVGGDEVVTVAYPQDLTPGDAKKVGAVLSALVGGDA